MKEDPKTAFMNLAARMKDLPSIPSSIARIMESLDNPDSTAKDLAAVIGLDQSLTSGMLKIVNSAFYGFPRRINTLEQAVTLLGYRTIKEVLIASSVMGKAWAKAGKRSLDRESFWRHAVGTAAAARAIAEKIGLRIDESVFLAGLLHDIGKVFLDAYLHDEYAAAVNKAIQENLLLVEAEERLLGATHAAFGYWLADAWNLPMNLASAVLHHHQPDKATDHYILTCLVHMGDILARALELGNGGDDLIPAINRQAWSSLNLTPTLVEKIIESLLAELNDSPMPF